MTYCAIWMFLTNFHIHMIYYNTYSYCLQMSLYSQYMGSLQIHSLQKKHVIPCQQNCENDCLSSKWSRTYSLSLFIYFTVNCPFCIPHITSVQEHTMDLKFGDVVAPKAPSGRHTIRCIFILHKLEAIGYSFMLTDINGLFYMYYSVQSIVVDTFCCMKYWVSST